MRTINLLKAQAEENARFLGDEKNTSSLPQIHLQSQATPTILPLPHTGSSPYLSTLSTLSNSPSSSPLLSFLPQQNSPLSSPQSSYSIYNNNNSSPVSSEHLTSSLASARGRKSSSNVGNPPGSNTIKGTASLPPSHNHHHNYHTSLNSNRKISTISEEESSPTDGSEVSLENNTSNHNSAVSHEGDPFFKFYSTMTTVVKKTYTQTRDISKVKNKFAKQHSQSTSPNLRSHSPSQVLKNLNSPSIATKGSYNGSILSNSSSSSSSSTSSLSASINPNDSYYVVSKAKLNSKTTSTNSSTENKNTGATGNHHSSYDNITQEDLVNENMDLHEQLVETKMALDAYYETFERQKEILKSSLGQLRADIQSQDRKRNREIKLQIENLENENGNLRSQLANLKSKMDGMRKI